MKALNLNKTESIIILDIFINEIISKSKIIGAFSLTLNIENEFNPNNIFSGNAVDYKLIELPDINKSTIDEMYKTLVSLSDTKTSDWCFIYNNRRELIIKFKIIDYFTLGVLKSFNDGI